MSKKRSSKKAGVKLLATLLCVLLFLLLFAQSASAAPLGPGDVNSDGKIDVRDVTLVQRHVLGLSFLTAAQKALAIVKGFGTEPDARDVVLIMQRAIGKISTFPVQTGVTSPAFSTVATDHTVTITLTGGTFKAGAITAADFVFDGTNAAALNAGTFSRTSDTVVTMSGLTLAAATNNTVTVKEATMATRASSVAAVASTMASVISPAFSTVTTTNSVTITLTGGTFKAGTITAADFTFAGDNAARLAAGTFTRTSDTVVTITGLMTIVAATNNTVAVKDATMATRASLVTAASVITPITSASFSTATTTNRVTITLTGGTFKAAPITDDDFIFTGNNDAIMGTGSFARTSDTVVTITGLGGLVADTNNKVTVKAATMATQAASVSGAATTIIAVDSAPFTTTAAHNRVTITLTGGSFKAVPTAADFTFTGSGGNDAALALGSFTRTSDRVVTITGLTLTAQDDNAVTVKPAAMATQASSVTAVASEITAVTSLLFTTTAANNTITITLTGGSFRAAPITAADFIFAGGGGNDAALALGSFTRTSDRVVTITGLPVLAVRDDNAVTVNPSAMTTQAASVTATASTRTSVVSPAFDTKATNKKVTITLTGGTFKSEITVADFIFDGDNAGALTDGTFTRISATEVTITGLTLEAATNNTVTVKVSTFATQATIRSVAVVASD